MGRGWRPLVVGGVIVVTVFALAQAQVFAPSEQVDTSSSIADPARGEAIFERECASCHGEQAEGAVGPALADTGLSQVEVATVVQQGRGIMPAGIVTGQERNDVVAYVVSISSPAG